MAPSRQARSDFRARAVEAQIVGVMAVMMEFTGVEVHRAGRPVLTDGHEVGCRMPGRLVMPPDESHDHRAPPPPKAAELQ
jgi:hypothetical protein